MNNIVQVRLLGRMGNQLFQYACARKYAELHGARLEVGGGHDAWYGAKLFGFDPPQWSCELPLVSDRDARPPIDGADAGPNWGQVPIRLGGYFQYQNWIGILTRAELRMWYKLHVDAPHRPLVAHLRRGDYVGHALYCTVPVASYLAAMDKFSLGSNVTWISNAQPGSLEGDFASLVQSEILLRANSSFSWWAAVLSQADVYAPVVEDRVGDRHDIEFVHGNHPRFADTNRVGVPLTDLYLPE